MPRLDSWFQVCMHNMTQLATWFYVQHRDCTVPCICPICLNETASVVYVCRVYTIYMQYYSSMHIHMGMHVGLSYLHTGADPDAGFCNNVRLFNFNVYIFDCFIRVNFIFLIKYFDFLINSQKPKKTVCCICSVLYSRCKKGRPYVR